LCGYFFARRCSTPNKTSDGIGDRSVEEIAKHLGVINKAVGNDSEIKKVSLVACSLGSEYPKKLLPTN
jgi:hypothetical protein